jgi:hypothetical protein
MSSMIMVDVITVSAGMVLVDVHHVVVLLPTTTSIVPRYSKPLAQHVVVEGEDVVDVDLVKVEVIMLVVEAVYTVSITS